jgi:hypothetical protein
MRTVQQIQRELKRLGYKVEETCGRGCWEITARIDGDGHTILVTALTRDEAWRVAFGAAKQYVGNVKKTGCIVPISQ